MTVMEITIKNEGTTTTIETDSAVILTRNGEKVNGILDLHCNNDAMACFAKTALDVVDNMTNIDPEIAFKIMLYVAKRAEESYEKEKTKESNPFNFTLRR